MRGFRILSDSAEFERPTDSRRKRMRAREVQRPSDQRLVGPADRHGDHRHPRAKRNHRHARLALDKLAILREGTFGKNSNDPSLLKHPERPLDRARIGPLQVDRDRPHVAVKRRVQRGPVIDPRHDKEHNPPRHGCPEHHPVQIVGMVGSQDVGAACGKVREPRDLEVEQAPEHGTRDCPQKPVEERNRLAFPAERELRRDRERMLSGLSA